YYGDGARLDILQAAGAGRARAVLICVDKGDVAVRIAQLMRSEYPLVPVLARAFDRGIAMDLIQESVSYQIRETFESALVIGKATLETLGFDQDETAEIIEDVRRRDAARLDAQLAGGLQAGRGFFKGNMPVPAPLTPPRRPGRAANEE